MASTPIAELFFARFVPTIESFFIVLRFSINIFISFEISLQKKRLWKHLFAIKDVFNFKQINDNSVERLK